MTEFAPISSSGHLILVPWLLNWRFFLSNPDLNKTFDVALHIGTFVGAVLYFRRDLATYLFALARSIGRRSVSTIDERLAWFLVIGTIPGALVGAVGEDFIESRLGRPWLIAVMLALFGVVLYLVDRWSEERRRLEQLRLGDAVLMGLAQAAALQPGVSRSGVTITAGRGVGLDRPAAARFSFLLSIPIIAGAGLFKGLSVLQHGLPPGTTTPFLWGMVASAVSGFLAIWGLLSYLRRRDFAPFTIYRLAAASVVFTLIATGARTS